MPKVVTKQTRQEIMNRYKENNNQSQTAREFGVSYLFVHYLVHQKPIPRTQPFNKSNKSKCPITGW